MALARVFLRKPKIILFDEATAALDNETERKIQGSFVELCKGRTTVVIAHRLSTIVHADLILTIEEGRIVEKGTHSELIGLGGIYANMWDKQFREPK